MKQQSKIDSQKLLALHLATAFLEDYKFYSKLTVEEVITAYRCRVDNRGQAWDDGWNPMEHDDIEKAFGSAEVRRDGQHIMWSVVGSAVENWLDEIFSGYRS